MEKIKFWILELRAPFLTASIVPNLVGGFIAWHEGFFHWGYFFLAMLGTIFINLGVNMVNDYFDYKSGIDLKAPQTPFSGGSGLLPQGVLRPESVYRAGIFSFLIAALIGIFLTIKVGWFILLLGLFGILTAYFYTTEIAKRGFGEFIVGLDLGPLAVLGAYYVQARQIALEPLIASLPIGLLVAGILYINEFPDSEADYSGGRYHLVVRLGKKKAAQGYLWLMVFVYGCILFAVLSKIMPPLTLLALLTLPLAFKAIKTTKLHYDNLPFLIPAMALTIMLHLFIGLLLSLGYILDRII